MRQIVLVYLVLEAILLIVFWAWVLSSPAASSHFASPGSSGALQTFRLADIGVLAASAIGAASMIAAGAAFAKALVWLHAGAAVYAGVCAWNGWIDGTLTLTAVITMVPLVMGAASVAVLIERSEHR